jgi:hypothetical protein
MYVSSPRSNTWIGRKPPEQSAAARLFELLRVCCGIDDVPEEPSRSAKFGESQDTVSPSISTTWEVSGASCVHTSRVIQQYGGPYLRSGTLRYGGRFVNCPVCCRLIIAARNGIRLELDNLIGLVFMV